MKHKIIILVLSAAVYGCKLPEKTIRPSGVTVPGSFNGRSDTSAMSDMTYRSFFKDQNLVSLLDTALLRNAELLIAMQRVEVAKAGLKLQKGAALPSLDINASGGGRQYGKYTMDGAGIATTPGIPSPFTPDYLAGVSSSWEADIWGKLRNRKKAAQLRYLSSQSGRDFVATNVVAEVALRYYTLVSLGEELEIIRRNILLQERALEIVKLQKEVGKVTELAVKQFTAQLAITRAMEPKIKTEISVTENELNFLLGRYAQPVVRKSSGLEEAVGMSHIGVPSQLVYRRPDIIQAELELNASETEVATARAAFLPSFSILASAGYNAFNSSFLFNPSSFAYGFVAGLSAPVFNRNQITANYDMTKAQHKGAYLVYGKTVLGAVMEVCTCLENLEGLQSHYASCELAANTLNDAVKISNDIYLAGYANYLEVITAQKNALDAELQVVQLRRNILFAKVNLYRALGGR